MLKNQVVFYWGWLGYFESGYVGLNEKQPSVIWIWEKNISDEVADQVILV